MKASFLKLEEEVTLNSIYIALWTIPFLIDSHISNFNLIFVNNETRLLSSGPTCMWQHHYKAIGA